MSDSKKFTLAKLQKQVDEKIASSPRHRFSLENYFRKDGTFNVHSYNNTCELWISEVTNKSKRFCLTDVFANLKSEFVTTAFYPNTLEFVPVPTSSNRKGPRINGWQNTTIKNWHKIDFKKDDGIAIVTGKPSNIFVIDIDLPKGDQVDGLQWLKDCHDRYQEGLESASPKNRKSYEELGGHYANTMVQRSGGGGIHLFYQYEPLFDLIKSGSRVLFDENGKEYSIDFKGNKGSITFAPSIHITTGNKYELLEEFDGINTKEYPNFMPGYLKLFIMENLQNHGYSFADIDAEIYGSKVNDVWITPNTKKEEKMNKKNFVGSNLEEINGSIEKLCAKLNFERFDNYDSWVSLIILLANLSEQHGNAEKYKKLCIKISQTSSKWDDAALKILESTWQLGKKERSIGIGTLMYWLKKDLSKQDYFDLIVDCDIIKNRRNDYCIGDIDRFANTDLLVSKIINGVEVKEINKSMKNEIYNALKCCVVPIRGDYKNGLIFLVKEKIINSEYGIASYCYTVTDKRKLKSNTDEIIIKNSSISETTGKYKNEPISNYIEVLAKSSNVCSKINFYPFSPKNTNSRTLEIMKEEKVHNLFAGFHQKYNPNYVINTDLLKPALNQINAFCNDDQVLVDYFIKWLAHIVQFPNKKNGTAIIIRSPQGTGKTSFFDWIGNMIIGSTYFASISSMEQITGRFNSTVGTNILIALEEVNVYENNCAVLNKLKDLITCKTQNIEFKGKEPIKVDNYNNFVLLTNKNYPIKAEASDRRYFCLESRGLYPVGDARWAQQFEFYYNHEAAENFYHYLMSVNVTQSDIINIPSTETKDDLINRGAPLFARFLFYIYSEVVLDGTTIDGVRLEKDNFCIDSIDVKRLLNSYCEENGEKTMTIRDISSYINITFKITSGRLNCKTIDGKKGKTPKFYRFNINAVRAELDKLKFKFDEMEDDVDIDDRM